VRLHILHYSAEVIRQDLLHALLQLLANLCAVCTQLSWVQHAVSRLYSKQTAHLLVYLLLLHLRFLLRLFQLCFCGVQLLLRLL
jgi:hypothetical protein